MHINHCLSQYALLACLLVPSLFCSGCDNERGSEEPALPFILHVTLDAPRPELVSPTSPPNYGDNHHALLERIDEAATDPLARGILVSVGPLAGMWGRVDELTNALHAYRKTSGGDRAVHCHFSRADNVSYLLLASACTHITMSPAGDLGVVGPSATLMYAASLLKRVGLHADVMHAGRFKGTGDVLIRDSMPVEAEEETGALLDALAASLRRAIIARLKIDDAAAQALIDKGPFLSSDALESKLVDALGSLEDAKTTAQSKAGVTLVVEEIPDVTDQKQSVFEVVRMMMRRPSDESAGEPHIAVVIASGNIVEAASDFGSTTLVQEVFIKHIRKLRDDPAVQAVVLRMDSPGGSALASDEMWLAVRDLSKAKPVFTSIGDVAASGGYYIASATRKIYANENSIVGSIGVVGGKISFGELADRVGVHMATIDRGAHASWMTTTRPFTESERAIFERSMRDIYDRFISRVAEGRGMKREDVLKAAEGRVMVGSVGKQFGLVDEVGGFLATIAAIRSEAGLSEDTPLHVWPEPVGFLEAIQGLLAFAPSAHALGSSSSSAQALAILLSRGALVPLGEGGLAQVAAYTQMLTHPTQVAATLPSLLIVR